MSKLGFPFGFPFGFRARPSSRVAIINAGSVDTPPLLMLVGKLVSPEITITRTDGTTDSLTFSGTIDAGDELHVDTADRTVLLNGDADRISLLDASASTWFTLPAGSTTLTLSATSAGDGAGLRVTWRDGYQ